MTNIYRLIIFLPLVILGCAPNVIEENIVIQISHLPNAIKKADKLFEFNKSGKVRIITKRDN